MSQRASHLQCVVSGLLLKQTARSAKRRLIGLERAWTLPLVAPRALGFTKPSVPWPSLLMSLCQGVTLLRPGRSQEERLHTSEWQPVVITRTLANRDNPTTLCDDTTRCWFCEVTKWIDSVYHEPFKNLHCRPHVHQCDSPWTLSGVFSVHCVQVYKSSICHVGVKNVCADVWNIGVKTGSIAETGEAIGVIMINILTSNSNLFWCLWWIIFMEITWTLKGQGFKALDISTECCGVHHWLISTGYPVHITVSGWRSSSETTIAVYPVSLSH